MKIPGQFSTQINSDVEQGDAARLEQYLRGLDRRNHTAIYFSSPGGSLYEGMKIGLVLRDWRVKTVVDHDTECASACALAFLGGRDRHGNKWMSSTTRSKLGFHAFSKLGQTTADTNEIQLTVSDILEYALEVDAPTEIMIRNFRTSSNSMDWLSIPDMLSLGIRVYDISRQCFLPCDGSQSQIKKPGLQISSFTKPSFDCSKAGTPQTIVICQHEHAARADRYMNEVWLEVRSKYRTNNRAVWSRILRDQKNWIARRDRVCTITWGQLNRGDNVAGVGDCIANYTYARAAELGRY